MIGLCRRWSEIRRRADVLHEEADDAHEGWLKVFAEAGYTGDYFWTIIE